MGPMTHYLINLGKKPKNVDEVTLEDEPNPNLKIGESSSQGKEFAKLSDPNLVPSKDISDEEQKLDNLSDEKVDFDPNEDDLLSSQELEEFAKIWRKTKLTFNLKLVL
jgi:DNA replication protein DnaD